jgi:hypothetical protein
MTRAEAIRAMDRRTRVRIGAFRNPDSWGYCEGVITHICRCGVVGVEDDGGTTYFRPQRTVRAVGPAPAPEPAPSVHP